MFNNVVPKVLIFTGQQGKKLLCLQAFSFFFLFDRIPIFYLNVSKIELSNAHLQICLVCLVHSRSTEI